MTYRMITAGLLALALVPAAAGCGSDSDTGGSGAAAPAKPAPATPALDTEEQHALDQVRADFTAYCKTKRNEPVGSAALAESLLDYGAATRTTGGSTIGADMTKSRDELKACGAHGLAKRLTKALNAAS
jgi:hypothetical protein